MKPEKPILTLDDAAFLKRLTKWAAADRSELIADIETDLVIRLFELSGNDGTVHFGTLTRARDAGIVTVPVVVQSILSIIAETRAKRRAVPRAKKIGELDSNK